MTTMPAANLTTRPTMSQTEVDLDIDGTTYRVGHESIVGTPRMVGENHRRTSAGAYFHDQEKPSHYGIIVGHPRKGTVILFAADEHEEAQVIYETMQDGASHA